MGLETNLNVAPYFDDFDETKHYHRILFKPSNAVQTRELNQVQTILQNQIERLGGSIYKDGAVISGCGIGYYSPFNYVRVADHAANGALLDVTQYIGKTVESTITGLRGQIVTVKTGSEQNFPWTNRLYVSYTNSGSVGNTQYQTFIDNDVLNIYDVPRSSNVLLTSVSSIVNNAISNTGIGVGYGVSVTSGLIYQKGFFITVDPQTIVISDSSGPANCVVGFITNENIITADQDSTLFDNSLGYANPNAPGADRLQLTANLAVKYATDVSTTSGFTSIVQFIGGKPVIQNADDKYSLIGDSIKKISYETNGSFVIKPFSVTTASANATTFLAQVSPGYGYAQGTRVELLQTTPVSVRRGYDTSSVDSQLITTNYGNYVICTELSGSFDFDNLQTVDIYDTAQVAVSSHTFASTGVKGTKIGTATLRCVKYYTGVVGTPTCEYEFYIFNIKMNSGKNFNASAKSFVYASGSAFADIQTYNGIKLYNAERRAMLWHFGTSALKTLKDSSNNINTEYVIRHRSNSTMANDGTISLTLATSHAGGTNEFPYGVGVLGDGREADFTVVLQAATSSPVLGNVSVSSSTMTGSGFASIISPNEYVLVGSDVRRVVTVTNTQITVDAPFSAANSAISYQKYFPAGYSFPLNDTMVGTRTITINSTISATINTGAAVAGTLTSAVAVSVYHNILRYNAVPAKKTINKQCLVQIDTSTHPNGNQGPWSLGFADVHKLNSVKVDASFNLNASDLSTNFYFDTGMRDTHYDLAALYLRPGQSIPANSKIVVSLDVFTLNTSPGIGFLTVDSYPVDDSVSNGTTTINTAEIPLYISESGARYPLRDCVDFRPYVTNLSNITTTLTGVTTNPASTSGSFVVDSAGSYTPCADENFQADLQYYIGRQDMVYFSNQGFIKVIEGNPGVNPQQPAAPIDAMGIAILNVPPYPSLSSTEIATQSNTNRQVYNYIRDTSNPVSISIITNKRYRMQDIGTLDKRISRMEYYTALNALEQATTSLQVSDASGLDRFKNGIFVDPFNDFSLSDVSNPEYKIAIDGSLSVARPFFNQENPQLDFNLASSTAIQQSTRLLTLPFVSTNIIKQPSATNFRACASVQFKWSGSVDLYPQYGNNVDKVANAATDVSLDLATPWQDFANSPFGMTWGDWNATSTQTSTTQSVAQNTVYGNADTTGYDTTTTTTTNYSRNGSQLDVGTSTTSYNLGSYVQNIAVQPYIASSEIAFYAWGMRPSTVLHAYFDNVLVDSNIAPGVRNTAVTDTTSSDYVTRTAAYGTPISTDANGTVYGKFLIPAGQFRTGERVFQLSDIALLKLATDAATTSASATYTSSNFTVTSGSTTLTTVNPVISTTSLSQTMSKTDVQTTAGTTTIALPPPTVINNTYVTNNITNNNITNNYTTLPPDQPNTTPGVIISDGPPKANTITYPCGVTFPYDDVMAAYQKVLATYSQPGLWAPITNQWNGFATVQMGGMVATDAMEFDWIGTNPATWTLDDFMNNYCLAPDNFKYDRPIGDPIAQMFLVNIPNGVAGMYVSDITVYFQNKSANYQNGITLYICETNNGYPDPTNTLPFSVKYLTWDKVNVSADGQTGTTFKFNAPVYVSNNTRYAFVCVPDGGDPDYRVWTAVLGNNDVFTGTQVSSKPYVDSAYYSTNQAAWSALQNEYIKFDLNRAQYTVFNGTAYFTTSPRDYVNINSVVNANTSLNISAGDSIFGLDANNNIMSTVSGKVNTYYVANGYMIISGTSGLFTPNANVQIHRLPSDGATPNSNTLISSATIASVNNVKMNALVPRFSTIAPSGTSVAISFTAASNTGVVDSAATNCVVDNDVELYDYERLVYSRSNEVANFGGQKMFKMNINIKSDTDYLSPAIDLVRSNFLAISNVIDPTTMDVTQEYTNNGGVQTKYISKVVTLANGQDSQDLQVYLTAFRPAGTKILVYAKFLSGSDPDTIINKTWTPLPIDDDTVFSNYRNITDYRELSFQLGPTIPTGAPSTTGYLDATNGLTYVSSSGSQFSSFKSFQLKIVLLADNTAMVPRLDDVRSLAMLL